MTDNEIIKVLEKEADFDCGMCSNNGENYLCEDCASLISKAALDLINRQNAEIARLQTDVAPVRHRRWIIIETLCGGGKERKYYRCSECNKANVIRSNYCPNCGARMDGDAE